MCARKVTKKTKKPSKISKALGRSRTSGAAKARYLNVCSPSEIRNSFSLVSRHRFFSDAIYLNLSKGVRDFYKPKLPPCDLGKSVAWCVSLVIFHKNRIQKALNEEDNLAKQVMLRNDEKVFEILDDIDKKCGISTWSLRLRGAIESTSSKDITSSRSIKNIMDLNGDAFFKYVVRYSSGYFKEEDIFFTSKNALAFEIEKSAPKSLRDFLLYKIFGLSLIREYDFRDIFNIEKDSSILDIFHLLIDFSSHFACGRMSEVQDYIDIKNIVYELYENFDYPPLKGLSAFFGKRDDWGIDKISREVVDCYTKGEYSNVCRMANNVGWSDFDFSIFELIVKSDLRAGELNYESTGGKISQDMKNTYTRNEQFEESLQSLACVSHLYRSLTWFHQLSCFVEREFPFVRSEDRENYDNLSLIYSSVDTPKKIKVVGEKVRQEFLEYLKCNVSSVSFHMYDTVYNKLDDIELGGIEIDEERKKKYRSVIFLNKGMYKQAAELLSDLSLSSDSLISVEASRMLIEALVLDGDYQEVIERFVEISLERENLLSLFDTKDVLDGASEYLKKSSSINVPIAYSLHSRFTDSEFDSNLKYSFEMFLSRNGAVFPNDLFWCEEKYGREKLNYFFKWVCTPEIMKLYLEFDGVRHTEECRLQVCNYLMERGFDDEFIRNEVKEINRAHSMKRAEKKVENSRVYVDTSVFYGRDSQKFRSLFEKYMELSKKEYSFEEDEREFPDWVMRVKEFSEEDGLEYWKGLSMIHFPSLAINSKNATFISLAKLFRSEFAYGYRGLNNHLSTRIRHGVLPTALRKPLVHEGLYAPKSSTSDSFTAPKWADNNYALTDFEKEQVDINIKDFSESYENLISTLNDEKLQIYILEEQLVKTGTDSQQNMAMFDYSISPLECYALQQELPISPSYNDFVKVAAQWLWDRTDYNLVQVQKYIRGTFKDQAVALLEGLKSDVMSSVSSEVSVSDFSNSIDRAKGALASQIDIVCSWFAHVDIDDIEEFDIETSIDIAKRSLNVEVELSSFVKCTLSERNLTYMVDVFFILFENALSKSRLSKDALGLKVDISQGDSGHLIIECYNKCSVAGDLKSKNNDIEFYRDAYGNEDMIRGVLQKEGGTGFFKIWKILDKDLETPHDIEMGFVEDDGFFVRLFLDESKSFKLKESV